MDRLTIDMFKLNWTKENCRKLSEIEKENGVPYVITGNGVGHKKAIDIIKSKKVKAQLKNMKVK